MRQPAPWRFAFVERAKSFEVEFLRMAQYVSAVSRSTTSQ
jgi:hypothetical protein